MLEAQVGVDLLTLIRGDEGICTDKMDLRLGAEDVGDDAGAVLVGVDLREQPFCDLFSIIYMSTVVIEDENADSPFSMGGTCERLPPAAAPLVAAFSLRWLRGC